MTPDERSKGDSVAAVPFRQTIRPLVIAPAGALVVIGCFVVVEQNIGLYLPIVLLLTAPFVYAAEAVFVLPLVLLSPACRRPSVAVGALWGAAAAWAFGLVLQTVGSFPPSVAALPSTWGKWQGIGRLSLPGIASGVLFVYLSRRKLSVVSWL